MVFKILKDYDSMKRKSVTAPPLLGGEINTRDLLCTNFPSPQKILPTGLQIVLIKGRTGLNFVTLHIIIAAQNSFQ